MSANITSIIPAEPGYRLIYVASEPDEFTGQGILEVSETPVIAWRVVVRPDAHTSDPRADAQMVVPVRLGGTQTKRHFFGYLTPLGIVVRFPDGALYETLKLAAQDNGYLV